MGRLTQGHAFQALLVLSCLGFAACDGSSPTEPGATPGPATVSDVIEALFLGQGRAAETSIADGCLSAGTWSSYPRGSQVRVLVASTVPEEAVDVIERGVADFETAASGFITIRVEQVSDPDPFPGPREISVTSLPQSEVNLRCGGGTVGGCTNIVSHMGFLLDSAQSFLAQERHPGAIHIHEVGHGLGLCHLDPGAVPGALMNGRSEPGAGWTAIELEAIHAVFTSGLEPGAGHEAFRQAGLIQ